MLDKTYRVTQMTCSACSAAVQRAVAKLAEVSHCDVNLATEKMTVSFDENKLGFTDLKRTVEKAGYGLVEEQTSRNLDLLIGGMTCAACSAAVERAAGKLPGVLSAQVNLATGKGSFIYDQSRTKRSEIMTAITNAGYTPQEAEGDALRDLQQIQLDQAVRRMKERVTIAVLFTIPVMFFAVAMETVGL